MKASAAGVAPGQEHFSLERVVLLPGDGIGPEVTREARRVLEIVAEARDMVTARLLPRSVLLDASDDLGLSDEVLKEVAPCLG